MRKTKVGNIEITIDPKLESLIMDGCTKAEKEADIYFDLLPVKTKKIAKEPGRARRVYNRLKGFLK